MFEIEGKIALITGGASGLGLCYAKELLRHGLKAVTLADHNEEFGTKALKEIEKEFGPNRAIFVKTDVTNRAQFEEAFKATIKAFKHLDIVINNAGILDDSIWEKQMLVNINGTMYGTYLALETYLQKYRSGPEGVIVNISSITGLDAYGCVPSYTATKHAVVGLSRSFGCELHYNRTKVKVITLCPGVTDTPLIQSEEGQNKTFSPSYKSVGEVEFANLPPQPTEYVAKAMVQIIKEGSTGSVWVAENKEPPYEVDIPERQNMRKK